MRVPSARPGLNVQGHRGHPTVCGHPVEVEVGAAIIEPKVGRFVVEPRKVVLRWLDVVFVGMLLVVMPLVQRWLLHRQRRGVLDTGGTTLVGCDSRGGR